MANQAFTFAANASNTAINITNDINTTIYAISGGVDISVVPKVASTDSDIISINSLGLPPNVQGQSLQIKANQIKTVAGVDVSAYTTTQLLNAIMSLMASIASITVTVSGTVVASLNASGTAAGGLSLSNQTAQTVDSTAVMAGVVKASAGRLGFISAFNAGATPAYVRIYNKATAADPTSDVPIYRGIIPANNSVGGGFIQPIIIGVSCSNGIAFRVTGGVKDTDTAALVANTIYLNIAYS